MLNKIMIMDADNSCWYKRMVGKTFKVIKEDANKYYVKEKSTSNVTIPILKKDCVLIS